MSFEKGDYLETKQNVFMYTITIRIYAMKNKIELMSIAFDTITDNDNIIDKDVPEMFKSIIYDIAKNVGGELSNETETKKNITRTDYRLKNKENNLYINFAYIQEKTTTSVNKTFAIFVRDLDGKKREKKAVAYIVKEFKKQVKRRRKNEKINYDHDFMFFLSFCLLKKHYQTF